MRSIALAVIVLFAVSAHVAFGADAPKAIDFGTVLVDVDGNPIKDGIATPADPDCGKCADLTLGRAVAHAMCSKLKGDEGLPEDEPRERCHLGRQMKAATAPVAELHSEQITTMIKAVREGYGPLVQDDAVPLLDPTLK